MCARDYDFFLSSSSMFPFAGIPLGSQLFSFSLLPGLVWDCPHPNHTQLISVFHSPGHMTLAKPTRGVRDFCWGYREVFTFPLEHLSEGIGFVVPKICLCTWKRLLSKDGWAQWTAAGSTAETESRQLYLSLELQAWLRHASSWTVQSCEPLIPHLTSASLNMCSLSCYQKTRLIWCI